MEVVAGDISILVLFIINTVSSLDARHVHVGFLNGLRGMKSSWRGCSTAGGGCTASCSTRHRFFLPILGLIGLHSCRAWGAESGKQVLR
jgi:hypothetical protein